MSTDDEADSGSPRSSLKAKHQWLGEHLLSLTTSIGSGTACSEPVLYLLSATLPTAMTTRPTHSPSKTSPWCPHPQGPGLAAAQQTGEHHHFPAGRAAWKLTRGPGHSLDPDAEGQPMVGPWSPSALQNQGVISSWQTPGTVFNSRLSGKGGSCSPLPLAKEMEQDHGRPLPGNI